MKFSKGNLKFHSPGGAAGQLEKDAGWKRCWLDRINQFLPQPPPPISPPWHKTSFIRPSNGGGEILRILVYAKKFASYAYCAIHITCKLSTLVSSCKEKVTTNMSRKIFTSHPLVSEPCLRRTVGQNSGKWLFSQKKPGMWWRFPRGLGVPILLRSAPRGGPPRDCLRNSLCEAWFGLYELLESFN